MYTDWQNDGIATTSCTFRLILLTQIKEQINIVHVHVSVIIITDPQLLAVQGFH